MLTFGLATVPAAAIAAAALAGATQASIVAESTLTCAAGSSPKCTSKLASGSKALPWMVTDAGVWNRADDGFTLDKIGASGSS